MNLPQVATSEAWRTMPCSCGRNRVVESQYRKYSLNKDTVSRLQEPVLVGEEDLLSDRSALPVPTVLDDPGGMPAIVLPARDHSFQEYVGFPYPACFIPYRQAVTIAPPGYAATRPSTFAAQTHWYVVAFRTLTNPRLAAGAMNFPSGKMWKISIDFFAPPHGCIFGLLFGWCLSRGSRCGSIFACRRLLCLYRRGRNGLLRWGCCVGAGIQHGDLWYVYVVQAEG